MGLDDMSQPSLTKKNDNVSIHEPAWDSTMNMFETWRCSVWFQSTSPHGARLHRASGFRSGCNGFNPRARMGLDWASPWNCGVPEGFNPRARMGLDMCGMRSQCARIGFNPRARMGLDCGGFNHLISRWLRGGFRGPCLFEGFCLADFSLFHCNLLILKGRGPQPQSYANCRFAQYLKLAQDTVKSNSIYGILPYSRTCRCRRRPTT